MPISPDIQRQLDSDDEYPDLTAELEEQEENAVLPAYLMDDRFESLDFTFPKATTVNKTVDHNEYSHDSKRHQNHTISILQQLQRDLYTKTCQLKKNKSVVVEAGVLSRQDLTCLQAVEPSTSDAGLLWFLNYLKRRDLQKVHEIHLVSCLAVDYSVGVYQKQDEAPFRKLHNFTLSVI